jgi:hypothetical protein
MGHSATFLLRDSIKAHTLLGWKPVLMNDSVIDGMVEHELAMLAY